MNDKTKDQDKINLPDHLMSFDRFMVECNKIRNGQKRDRRFNDPDETTTHPKSELTTLIKTFSDLLLSDQRYLKLYDLAKTIYDSRTTDPELMNWLKSRIDRLIADFEFGLQKWTVKEMRKLLQAETTFADWTDNELYFQYVGYRSFCQALFYDLIKQIKNS